MKRVICYLGLGVTLLMAGCAGEPEPAISQDEAIDIASKIVPSDIADEATIEAKLNPDTGIWLVRFDDIESTEEELGWSPGPDVHLGLPGMIYTKLLIQIDSETGEILKKLASKGPPLSGEIPE
jgi:hypothetical protein